MKNSVQKHLQRYSRTKEVTDTVDYEKLFIQDTMLISPLHVMMSFHPYFEDRVLRSNMAEMVSTVRGGATVSQPNRRLLWDMRQTALTEKAMVNRSRLHYKLRNVCNSIRRGNRPKSYKCLNYLHLDKDAFPTTLNVARAYHKIASSLALNPVVTYRSDDSPVIQHRTLHRVPLVTVLRNVCLETDMIACVDDAKPFVEISNKRFRLSAVVSDTAAYWRYAVQGGGSWITNAFTSTMKNTRDLTSIAPVLYRLIPKVIELKSILSEFQDTAQSKKVQKEEKRNIETILETLNYVNEQIDKIDIPELKKTVRHAKKLKKQLQDSMDNLPQGEIDLESTKLSNTGTTFQQLLLAVKSDHIKNFFEWIKLFLEMQQQKPKAVDIQEELMTWYNNEKTLAFLKHERVQNATAVINVSTFFLIPELKEKLQYLVYVLSLLARGTNYDDILEVNGILKVMTLKKPVTKNDLHSLRNTLLYECYQLFKKEQNIRDFLEVKQNPEKIVNVNISLLPCSTNNSAHFISVLKFIKTLYPPSGEEVSEKKKYKIENTINRMPDRIPELDDRIVTYNSEYDNAENKSDVNKTYLKDMVELILGICLKQYSNISTNTDPTWTAWNKETFKMLERMAQLNDDKLKEMYLQIVRFLEKLQPSTEIAKEDIDNIRLLVDKVLKIQSAVAKTELELVPRNESGSPPKEGDMDMAEQLKTYYDKLKNIWKDATAILNEDDSKQIVDLLRKLRGTMVLGGGAVPAWYKNAMSLVGNVSEVLNKKQDEMLKDLYKKILKLYEKVKSKNEMHVFLLDKLRDKPDKVIADDENEAFLGEILQPMIKKQLSIKIKRMLKQIRQRNPTQQTFEGIIKEVSNSEAAESLLAEINNARVSTLNTTQIMSKAIAIVSKLEQFLDDSTIENVGVLKENILQIINVFGDNSDKELDIDDTLKKLKEYITSIKNETDSILEDKSRLPTLKENLDWLASWFSKSISTEKMSLRNQSDALSQGGGTIAKKIDSVNFVLNIARKIFRKQTLVLLAGLLGLLFVIRKKFKQTQGNVQTQHGGNDNADHWVEFNPFVNKKFLTRVTISKVLSNPDSKSLCFYSAV